MAYCREVKVGESFVRIQFVDKDAAMEKTEDEIYQMAVEFIEKIKSRPANINEEIPF